MNGIITTYHDGRCEIYYGTWIEVDLFLKENHKNKNSRTYARSYPTEESMLLQLSYLQSEKKGVIHNLKEILVS